MKIIFVHGYSGSPHNFFGLDETVAKETKSKVSNEFLPGHEAEYEKLLPLNYKDFYKHIEKQCTKDCIIVGYSLGSLIGLELAAKNKHIKGVIAFSTPYDIKFPFNLTFPKSNILLKKKQSQYEVNMSRFKTYMNKVPLNGLRVLNTGKKEMSKILERISKPVVLIELEHDLITSKKNPFLLHAKISNSDLLIIKNRDRHNPLFPEPSKEVEKKVLSFIKKIMKTTTS